MTGGVPRHRNGFAAAGDGYGDGMVRLVVVPELRFLLPVRWRAGAVEVAADPTASLGHVVQSVGIPLTEVGELRVAGRVVPAGRRAGSGERRPAAAAGAEARGVRAR